MRCTADSIQNILHDGPVCRWNSQSYRPFAQCSEDIDCVNCESTDFSHVFCEPELSACHFNCGERGVALNHGKECFNKPPRHIRENAVTDEALWTDGPSCKWNSQSFRPFAVCTADDECINCESQSFTFAFCDPSLLVCHFNCDALGVPLSHGGQCL